MEHLLLRAVTLLDAGLIAPFRLFADPVTGFLCGMAVLATASVVLGRLGVAGLSRLQRDRREREEGEVRKHHQLSMLALQAKDKAAYLASNRLAQEAHGNAMALAAGRAAALFWPACAALAWASWRFSDVPLPLVGGAAGPAAFFFPFYLAAYWGLSRLGRRRPPADQPPSPRD